MENLTGKLLISPPNIGDRRFSSTVIYVVSHNESGSWGLIVNKPTMHSNTDIMYKLGIQAQVPGIAYLGGPVNTGTVHILHDGDDLTSETIFGPGGIHLNCDLGFVGRIMDRQNSDNFRLIVGCCTWAPGQLEGELLGQEPWRSEHSWLIADADSRFVFSLNGEEQWQQGVELAAASAVKNWMS
jgi:putative transcriptional regulator